MHIPPKREAPDTSRVLSNELQTLEALAIEAVWFPNEVKVIRLQEVRKSLSSLHACLCAELVRGTPVPVDPADPWRGLYDPARLPARNAMGEVMCHPDVPAWADGREESLAPLFNTQGFELQVVLGEFADEGSADGEARYWQEMRDWAPVPSGTGWRLAWLGETEDGPAAWFVRPLAIAAMEAQGVARG